MNKNVIIGVAGHVDHGKTSFVHCLTGIDTDRHPEEKRRGLSLDYSKEVFDFNRKIGLHVLEHLDRVGFTFSKGEEEGRVLR